MCQQKGFRVSKAQTFLCSLIEFNSNTKKPLSFVYGIVGCVFSATYAYFNGTLTTMEKRFKIPSQNLGIISIGNDLSSLFLSAILSYYAGKQNRPRWIAFGLISLTFFCIFSSLPHYIWGPGEQALSLTKEFGANEDSLIGMEIIERERRKRMCNTNCKACAPLGFF